MRKKHFTQNMKFPFAKFNEFRRHILRKYDKYLRKFRDMLPKEICDHPRLNARSRLHFDPNVNSSCTLYTISGIGKPCDDTFIHL
jgi:hypothetical protein